MRNDVRLILGLAVVMLTAGWLSLRSANADLEKAVQAAQAQTGDDA